MGILVRDVRLQTKAWITHRIRQIHRIPGEFTRSFLINEKI